MKKGQVSFEFLMIVSFAFLLIMPIMIIFMTQANDLNNDVTGAQVNKLAEELQETVNEVYYLGSDTTRTLEIYIPKFVDSASFVNETIRFNITHDARSYLIVKTVDTSVSGSLNTNPGVHRIRISATDYGTVEIQG